MKVTNMENSGFARICDAVDQTRMTTTVRVLAKRRKEEF